MHTVKDLSTSAAIKRGYRVEVAFASGFVKGQGAAFCCLATSWPGEPLATRVNTVAAELERLRDCAS